METPNAIATAEAPLPNIRVDPEDPRSARPTPGMILLLSIWIGLAAGFLDLGILVVRNRMTNRDFYHLSQDFVWIIPVAIAVLVLMPGMVLALIALLRRKSVSPQVAVVVLSFMGFLDVIARFPLDVWAIVLLATGLAIQSGRMSDSRIRAFLTLARRTSPLLIGLLLASILVTVGGRAWSEHRAIAALPPPPPSARNLLLIVWDTVRAANTSLHGYNRRTTPNLEKLAARGVRFDRAFATSSWTLPSHASLFTGGWPHELGVDWRSPLRRDVPTLAEYLGSRGYDTAGFVGNLDYCGRESGLDRGFARYEDYPLDPWDALNRYVALGFRLQIPSLAYALDQYLEKYCGLSTGISLPSKEHVRGAAAVGEAFLDWLDWQRGRRRPFFAFLNLNDAHSPYEVPDRSVPGFGLRPSSGRDRLTLANWNILDKVALPDHDLRMAVDVYDDSIAHLDRRLQVVLDELSRRGVLDDTLVIVASDHGEHLGDHQLFFHGCSLYRQLVQVPLVIVHPQGVPAGQVISRPVSLRDVPATVVDLLGLGRSTPFAGRSLARFWNGDGASDGPLPEPLLMETGQPLTLTNHGREPAAKGPMSSLVTSGMHYIRSADGREELYLLDSDPEERHNQVGSGLAAMSLPGLRRTIAAMFKRR